MNLKALSASLIRTALRFFRSNSEGGSTALRSGQIVILCVSAFLLHINASMAHAATYPSICTAAPNCIYLAGAGTASTSLTPARVDLSWSAMPNATGYNILISTTNGGPYTQVSFNGGTTNQTSFADETGLTNGYTYYFVVQAFNASGVICQSFQRIVAIPYPRGTSPLVTVSPSASLYAGQTQQMSATISGGGSQAVTWAINPAGAGTISSSGLYTAPATVPTQQQVVITATSQSSPTRVGTAIVTLQCPTCGYNDGRVIIIDHTKVPNTDQVNFPFLFNVTDPLFATTANGGHVASSSGYDIFFSTDPNGLTKLDHELDQYNPVTGQVTAWIRIPTLSHTSDTILYVFYGNSAITTSQQNAPGVWSNGYAAVYHMGSSQSLNTGDSTGTNGNAANNGVTAATGAIGGAGNFASGSSFLDITNNSSLKPGSTLTLEAWVNARSLGDWNKIVALDYRADGSWNPPFLSYALQSYYNTSGMGFQVTEGGSGTTVGTQGSINLNTWNHVVGTYDGTQVTEYLNGIASPSTPLSGPIDYGTSQDVTIGARSPYSQFSPEGWNGLIDEVRISSVARSADWIATEYDNQSSPSTFYKVLAENAMGMTPTAATLYASQNSQFTVIPLGACTTILNWTVGAGTVTPSGLYSAPSSVSSQQTTTITATNPTNTVNPGTASLILLPPSAQSVLTLTSTSPSPYSVGSTQTFVASLTDPVGNPESGVAVDFVVAGANPSTVEVVTNGSGLATYTYTGIYSGTDGIQASASTNVQPATSNTLSVTWIPPVFPNGQFSLTLSPSGPAPTLGLVGLAGAFTDSTGAVIEPVSIGAKQKVLIVPAGATQLQLGVDDDRFGDNYGSGFLVDVNGVPVTVSSTTMPWVWASGGLNSNLPFGILDGSSPVVAATNLISGQGVAVAYHSGTVSAGIGFPLVNADGYSGEITGTILGSTGTHFSTDYMFDLSRPVGQSITFTATVHDGSGNPVVNTPVTFSVTGANAQQLSATTDVNGNAVISYSGQLAGTDTIQAQASPAGSSTVLYISSTLIWTPIPSSASGGTLQLTPASVSPASVGGQYLFTALARSSSGSPLSGVGVGLSISGADNTQLQGVTDASGQVQFVYHNTNAGTATVQSIALISGQVTYSNSVTTTWTSSGSGGGGTANSINISIQSNPTVTIPNALQLNATVTDSSLPPGNSTTLTWSQLAGPGSTTFANSAQSNTTATFTVPGNYVLQLAANDGINSSSAQVSVGVDSSTGTQGWIGSPNYGSTLTGVVPITVAPGVTLTSGRLIYYAANDPYATNPVVLNANVAGTGQIGTFDTTLLPNGSYYIQLQATNSAGQSAYSIALVTVAGQYKPGRVTTTVTDLVVPATGLAINIQRQYDSLNAATSSDFGYGWSLSTNVNLFVDPSYNVTFTLGGQRRTFYFTPQYQFFFLGYVGGYTPEPGLPGSLSAVPDETNCPFDYIIPNSSTWECGTGAPYSPVAYVYTDPSGTQYTMNASGTLQSVSDIGGNTLTVTPNGITSSTGLSVPFIRDSSGRITKITDPQGNNYLYTYDGSGNLASVTYPGITQASTYTYNPSHLYLSGMDFRNNPLPITAYYGSTDTDPNGFPLNGRMQSVTDALGETTSYAYNLATNTTTITYPPDANNNIGTATMVYDNYGMLLSSTDPLGLITTNAYDASHNMVSVTDPLGHTNSYSYDALGNRTSSTYPATTTSTNTTSTITYNQNSEPISSTDELGNVRFYNYDANSWPTSVTDGIGVLMSSAFNANGTMAAGAIGYNISSQPSYGSTFAYDAYGNRTGATDALGRTTSYTYNTLGQKTSMIEPYSSGTSPSSATTTYNYDPFGHLIQTSAPLGRTTSSSYDANGHKISDTDPNGNVTSYAYDSLNRLVTTTYPTSPATTVVNTYDFRGNIITQTDQAGNVTKNQYDLSGRLLSVTKAFGTANAVTTSYTYYNDGRKHTETDSLGHTTTYTYDAAGNLTAVAGVNGNFTYAYDNARNRVSMTDGNSHTTQYQYDARKRLTKTTYPDTTTVTNTYDGPGNLAGVTDQAGNVVNYTYDTANQLQTVVQANSPNAGHNTNTYGYDLLGDLSSSSDANTHVTVNGYDLLSELKTKTLPDGSLTESRTYDAAGNLSSITHFNGKTTTYSYDSLNRLTTRTPDPSLGEATVSFTYTATGKRATMTDASGTTTYGYNSADRLTTKATPAGTLNYTYDAAGHVASIASSNTNGASMSYTYDSLNRLSTVVDNRLSSGHNTTTYTYDPASNVATVTYPNGLQSTFTYDSLNRLTALSTPPVSSYSYTLGATGNRTNATEQNGRTLNWTYDGIYRLTSETIASDPAGGNGAVGYGLDPAGNRQSASSTLPGISTSISSFNVDDLMSTETYDTNGNTIGTGGKTFTYDSENRLTSMNGVAVTVVYDGDGNRVEKTASGVTTRYLVDDLNPTGYAQVIEEVIGGTAQREYTYGLQRVNQNQLINGVWTPSFYGYDGGGSVRQLTNAGATITDTYNYDAFGNLLNSTGTTPNNYKYRGEQYDSDLGLYYLRARYMNPVTGRFMSRDSEDGKPIDPKTLHKYLYAGGDPIDAKDPTGRAELFENAVLDTTLFPALREAAWEAGYWLAKSICTSLVELGTSNQMANLELHGQSFLADLYVWCAAFVGE